MLLSTSILNYKIMQVIQAPYHALISIPRPNEVSKTILTYLYYIYYYI